MQRGRREEIDDRTRITNSGEWQIEVAAGAFRTRSRCCERTVGACRHVDIVGLERGDEGFLRNLDIVYNESRHMQRRMLDDDTGAIGLNQYKVVAIDLDALDGGAGRQLDGVVFRNGNDHHGRGSARSRGFDGDRRRGFSLCNLDLLFTLECDRALNLLVRRIGRQILSEAFGSHRQTPFY